MEVQAALPILTLVYEQDSSARSNCSRQAVLQLYSTFLQLSNTTKMGLLASLSTGLPELPHLKNMYDAFLAPYLVQLALASVLVYYLSVKFDRILYDIPGPVLASFTSIWKIWDTYKGDSQYNGMTRSWLLALLASLHVPAIKLHRQLGPLVRVGPKHVSVGDPAEIKTIYSVNGGFTKTAFYPIQAVRYEKKPLLNLFATRDESYHSRIKRPIAHTYSMAALTALEPKIDHVSKLLMQKLQVFQRTNQAIDLGEWLQYVGNHENAH